MNGSPAKVPSLDRHDVAAVLLAAGRSERMGATNKLLMQWRGQPLITHALNAYTHVGFGGVWVVTGFERDRLAPLISQSGAYEVFNPDYRQGHLSSLQAGLAAIGDHWGGVVIGLADQPLITCDEVCELFSAFRSGSEQGILIPFYHDREGHPRFFSRRHFLAMRQAGPLLNPKRYLAANHHAIVRVNSVNPSVIVDIDTPADAERIGAA
ncbi:MAG: nucleotidyltransferase family protein [Pseudomonadota bacterium]|nr:nucleotidyltransferase family protein [Pseudomonadota bacterium]